MMLIQAGKDLLFTCFCADLYVNCPAFDPVLIERCDADASCALPFCFHFLELLSFYSFFVIVRRDKIPDVSLVQRMLALPNRCPSDSLPGFA